MSISTVSTVIFLSVPAVAGVLRGSCCEYCVEVVKMEGETPNMDILALALAPLDLPEVDLDDAEDFELS